MQSFLLLLAEEEDFVACLPRGPEEEHEKEDDGEDEEEVDSTMEEEEEEEGSDANISHSTSSSSSPTPTLPENLFDFLSDESHSPLSLRYLFQYVIYKIVMNKTL